MEEKGAKFRDYFDWDEPVAGIPSHRMLAIRRGEKEDFLNLDILPDEEEATAILENLFVKGEKEDSAQVKLAVNGLLQASSFPFHGNRNQDSRKRKSRC